MERGWTEENFGQTITFKVLGLFSDFSVVKIRFLMRIQSFLMHLNVASPEADRLWASTPQNGARLDGGELRTDNNP